MSSVASRVSTQARLGFSVATELLIPSFVASREDFSPSSLCQSKDETQRSQSASVCSVLVLVKAQSTRRSRFLVAANGRAGFNPLLAKENAENEPTNCRV